MEFPKRLKELRLQKQLTQPALGKFFNLSKQTIWAYENGETSPNPETLKKLADFFEVTTDYLLGRDNPPISGKFTENEYGENINKEKPRKKDGFGIRLKKVREQRNMAVDDVAEMMNVTPDLLKQWESGLTEIPLSELVFYCLILGIDIPDLFSEQERQSARELAVAEKGGKLLPQGISPVQMAEMPIYSLANSNIGIYSPENIVGYKVMPLDHIHDSTFFEVPDDSMSGSRLYKGDIIRVIKQNFAEDGQVAVVRLTDGSLLVRRIKNELIGIVVYPDNPAYNSQPLKPNEHTIIGVVVDVTFEVK